MKRVLFSLVSEQTLPNVIVAAHFRPDVLLFLTTRKAEDNGWLQSIIQTLRGMNVLHEGVTIDSRLVEEYSFKDCLEKIDSLLECLGDVDFVNITGGTKIMALAAFIAFRDTGGKILYLPLGTNRCIQLIPRKKPLYEFDIEVRLTVEQYLNCYGFSVTNQSKHEDKKSAAQKRDADTRWILDHYEKLKGVLGFLFRNLREGRRRKRFELSALFDRKPSAVETEFFRRFGFTVKDRLIERVLTKDECRYFTGEWLEDYVFNRVDGLVSEGTLDDAMSGIKVVSYGGNENELDVVFTAGNVFYHIECKTLGENEGAKIINDEIYKKGALSTLLGKGEKKGYVCTTLEEVSEAQKKRAEEYGLEILTLGEVRRLERILKERFA